MARKRNINGSVKTSLGLLLVAATMMSSAGAHPAPLMSHIHLMRSLPAQIAAHRGNDCVLPVIVVVACGDAGLPMMTTGGLIQTNPSVYIVRWKWSSDPSGEKAYQDAFFRGVGGSSFASSQTQYCDKADQGLLCPSSGVHFVGNPSGVLKGEWDDTSSTPPSSYTDNAIAREAISAASHFGVTSNPNAEIIIDLPHGLDAAFNAGLCAYHASTSSGGHTIAFTYFPYTTDGGTGCGANSVKGPLDGVSIVGGHEYAETLTDPDPTTGWADPIGEETGDKCAFILAGPGALHSLQLSTGNFAVQTLWSNEANFGAGGCV